MLWGSWLTSCGDGGCAFFRRVFLAMACQWGVQHPLLSTPACLVFSLHVAATALSLQCGQLSLVLSVFMLEPVFVCRILLSCRDALSVIR